MLYKNLEQVVDYYENSAPSEIEILNSPEPISTYITGRLFEEYSTAGKDLTKLINECEYNGKSYIKINHEQDIIDRLNPDKIDNKLFWTTIRNKYPNLSVVTDRNYSVYDNLASSWKVAQALGLTVPLVQTLRDHVTKSKDQYQRGEIDTIVAPRVFEIGYGQGAVYNMLRKYMNYTGIDYYPPAPVFDIAPEAKFIEIERSGIPQSIPDDSQDIVFSSNTFQHLTGAQREQYFIDAHRVLVNNGHFIFSAVVYTDETINTPVFEVFNPENTTPYLLFFKQFTPVPNMQDVLSELKIYGFDIEDYELRHRNQGKFICRARK